MLSKPIDCGCGGGKSHCITKPENKFRAWVKSELKRLDCGCGCKGEKAFVKKYGKLVGGAILRDCPPGWRNDGLTCVENCKDDEYDDGLTCRKKCEPGWINDGLTCRKPITSSMNSCPAGSKDIAGTCWGPVRKDCIDDCFKHPAPGCKTWQCGRLRGAFGEDWGPKLCTSCNLRCGQTCWDVQGITKQLHQRDLKIVGGEVVGQLIRGKQIRGRVNFDELGKVLEQGTRDLLEGNIDLAAAFDPEKNGVNAAFRKFGSDINAALNEIQNKIKDGFNKMGADARRAFEELAKNAERDFKQFGADFVAKMKDPDFWTEFAAIMTEVALYAAATIATATGVGAAFAPGLLAAAAMAGPSIRMISKAAQGQPIDALDIVELAIAGASAALPGLSGITSTVVNVGINAAKVTVMVVKTGQALGMIPSSCLGPNCPEPPGESKPDPPLEPDIPGEDIPGQLTYEEISALQPPNTIKYKIKGVVNPDYIFEADWVAQYRLEHYGSSGDATKTEEDKDIEDATKVPITDSPTEIEADEFPPFDEGPAFGDEFPPFDEGPAFGDEFPPFDEGPAFGDDFPPFDSGPAFGDDFPPFEESPPFEIPPFEESPPFDENFPPFEESPPFEIPPFEELPPLEEEPPPTTIPTPELQPIETIETITIPEVSKEGTRFITEEELEADTFIPRAVIGGTKPEDLPLIEPIVEGDVTTNPWGSLKTIKAKAQIPLTHTGAEFNPECYARHNPEVAQAMGNDPGKLTTHWIEIGAKEHYNADCGDAVTTAEERMKLVQERESLEGKKQNCKATDRFWIEEEKRCDGTRHADGKVNTAAEECKENNNYWDTSGSKAYCAPYKDLDGKRKTRKQLCNAINSFYTGDRCKSERNVDATYKTPGDICTGLNNYWDDSTKTCDVTKNRDGKNRSEQELCDETGNFFENGQCNAEKNIRGEVKSEEEYCYTTIGGIYNNETGKCPNNAWKIPPKPITQALMKQRVDAQIAAISSQTHTAESIAKDLADSIELNRIYEIRDCMRRHRLEFLNTPEGKSIPESEYIPESAITDEVVRNLDKGIVVQFAKESRNSQAKELYEKCKTITGKAKPSSLTLYWAEWCPHCHDMMPEWKKLGSAYKGIKIEALEQKKTKVKVDGYPTIIFRSGNKKEIYEGPRTKSAIIKFLKNKLSIK